MDFEEDDYVPLGTPSPSPSKGSFRSASGQGDYFVNPLTGKVNKVMVKRQGDLIENPTLTSLIANGQRVRKMSKVDADAAAKAWSERSKASKAGQKKQVAYKYSPGVKGVKNTLRQVPVGTEGSFLDKFEARVDGHNRGFIKTKPTKAAEYSGLERWIIMPTTVTDKNGRVQNRMQPYVIVNKKGKPVEPAHSMALKQGLKIYNLLEYREFQAERKAEQRAKSSSARSTSNVSPSDLDKVVRQARSSPNVSADTIEKILNGQRKDASGRMRPATVAEKYSAIKLQLSRGSQSRLCVKRSELDASGRPTGKPKGSAMAIIKSDGRTLGGKAAGLASEYLNLQRRPMAASKMSDAQVRATIKEAIRAGYLLVSHGSSAKSPCAMRSGAMSVDEL